MFVASKEARPFLLHIHITLPVARRSTNIEGGYRERYSQYGWSVIGRIYLSVAALLIHITQLHLPSFYKEVRPYFWLYYILQKVGEYKSYTEEYGGV